MTKHDSTIIIGVDEAGRGCVFGPMAVAATARLTRWHNDRVKDSKKVSPKRRNLLYTVIQDNTLWSVAMIDALTIEQYGLQAVLKTAGDMVTQNVVDQVLALRPQANIQVIFDGSDRQDEIRNVNGVTIEILSIPRADNTVFECSAASILAKVTRDNWVKNYVRQYPDMKKYHLLSNMGYGTQKHREAIMEHGVTEHHRKAFCKSLLSNWAKKQQDEQRRILNEHAYAPSIKPQPTQRIT